jgi:hypothetical protein
LYEAGGASSWPSWRPVSRYKDGRRIMVTILV